MIIKFKKLSPAIGETISAPSYATPGAAGIDLAAAIVEPVTVEPGERVMIPTGLAVDMPTTEIVGLVFPRSGLAARHGLALANAVGVIDSDYKGEILCPVQNNGEQPYQIKPGDRIAQLLFMPVLKVQIEFTEGLSESERGKGGFGSTGR